MLVEEGAGVREMRLQPHMIKAIVFLSAAIFWMPSAYADCKAQLRILSDDLKDVSLSDSQMQSLASILMQARRNCWVQREQEAMDYITRARSVAGLKPPSAEFDWENVPLESLQPRN